MRKLREIWRDMPSIIRKPLVLIAGIAIILAGLAMLVLPGPGWVAIFLGFAILATEFAFAEKIRDWLVVQLKLLFGAARRMLHKISPKP
jgi:uncharacterized protein (TIGR02611 family)